MTSRSDLLNAIASAMADLAKLGSSAPPEAIDAYRTLAQVSR